MNITTISAVLLINNRKLSLFFKELGSKEIWWFTLDVTPAMLMVKNKSISHHWEF